MFEHRGKVAVAADAACGNIVQIAYGQHLAAHHSGKAGDIGDAQNEDQHRNAPSEYGHQRQCQNDWRDRHHRLDKPHQDIINPAAEVTGNEANRAAKDSGDHDCEDADKEGDPRTVDNPAEYIPPELICT